MMCDITAVLELDNAMQPEILSCVVERLLDISLYITYKCCFLVITNKYAMYI